MLYKIDYLPIAKRDITDISGYISDELSAPKAAMDLLDAFDKAIDGLRDFPYAYRVYQPVESLENEYRRIPVKNYVVFYTVDEQKRLVEIHRVLYAKMDLTKIFQ